MPSLAPIDRRRLLIGGGVGIGLVVGWAVWPRQWPVNLTAAAGEHVFGGWLKIGEDGHVTVAVPQLEHGQGSWTALPQIAADALGADWRTVAVEPAPLSPLYANPVAWRALFEGALDTALGSPRIALMATGGSSGVRGFAEPLAAAGAAARAVLCMEAAARTDSDWRQARTAAGFVQAGGRRLRFAELAAGAAARTAPAQIPPREDDEPGLIGQPLPRLDVPAKVDGSASFAGDLRLTGMVHAALRMAPAGMRLTGYDARAADRVPGARRLVATDGWLAAVGETWWAAAKALDAARPRFGGDDGAAGGTDGAAVARALTAAFDADGVRLSAVGDLGALFRGAQVRTADYRTGIRLHAPLESGSATARLAGGRLELWLATQAPGAARAAAAASLGMDPDRVTLHNVFAGGAFGERLETLLAAQVAWLARELARPVQLTLSRAEDLRRDRVAPPAAVRLAARLAANGQIAGWSAKVAAPATGHELAGRLLAGDASARAVLAVAAAGDPYATAGAALPYAVPVQAIDHHPADVGLVTGHLSAGMHVANVFARECFVDELAHVAGSEPVSYRIGMLGGDVRLARCLSTAAALGGWEGGVPSSGQGIAAHAMRGGRIALLAEAGYDGEAIRVERLVAAVDCGRVVNPALVRQRVEAGLVQGLAAALAAPVAIAGGLPTARTLGAVGLPRLAQIPDITVELIASEGEFGGVDELAIPVVAPAVGNALWAATGTRIRHLPLSVETA